MLAKILMPAFAESDVGLIIVQEFQLNRVIPCAVEEMLIESVRVGVDRGRVFDAMGVLKHGRVERKQACARLLSLGVPCFQNGFSGSKAGPMPST